MVITRMKLAALGLIAAVGLGGCTDGYGYSGVNVGYNGGYGDYGDGYYGDDYYGAGYGGGYYPAGLTSSYFGWYGDYYYPGTGYYVYGRDRRPYRWSDEQRRYWEGRRGPNRNWGNGQGRPNWQGFNGNQGRPGLNGTQGRPGFNGDGRPGFNRGDRGNRPDYNGTRPDRPAFTGNRPDRGGYGQGWRGNRQGFQPGQTAQPRVQREGRAAMGQRSFEGRPQGNAGRGGGRRSRD